jgi:hypothetical protein
LGAESLVKALTLVYAPDFNFYHYAPQESYCAQRLNDFVKVSAGNGTFTLTNSFLDNIGSRNAPIYSDSQTGGNTDDRFRNFYAFAVPRERRDQYQDRGTVALQYNMDRFFIRPSATTIYYDLKTVFHNAAAAPYIGYQNFPDRYDVNGGADIGYQWTPKFAVLLGYRYGHQYQQQIPLADSADQHFSTSDYQRALVGLEGSPWSWFTMKLSAGPDFRYYNPNAPVNNRHDVFLFVEGSATATITPSQSLSFYTKEWEWVSSVGLVPYYDSTYMLNYHWNASKQWAFDLGGKILRASFNSGNDLAGTAPSLRDDIQYTVSLGATYAFTPNLNARVAYNYDIGRNLKNLAPQFEPEYRDFDHQLVSVGLQYQF